MYKTKKIVGLIPARGGSKGLPGKNCRGLLGKPLIGWTIEQALGSRYIDRVVVSTDCPEIAGITEKFGAEIPFFRPAGLSTDKSTTIDVILHSLEYFAKEGYEFDYLVLLEPTSPLRESLDIDNSLRMLVNNKVGAVSVVSVSEIVAAHPSFAVMITGRDLIAPYQGKFFKTIRRQDLKKLYFFEGTIYASKVNELIKRKSFYHDRTLAYIVPKWKSFEVDDIVDFVCVEAVMNKLQAIKKQASSRISRMRGLR